MPQPIQAYKSKDGTIWEDEWRAADHDARCDLREFLSLQSTPGGSDAEWADFLVHHALRLHEALDPIVQASKGPVTRGQE